MTKSIAVLVLMIGSMAAFGQAAAPAPATPSGSAPAPTVQQKDTTQLIKARLKAYKAQQKQSMKLAKAQTKLALEQLKLVEITTKTNADIAGEAAKANAGK